MKNQKIIPLSLIIFFFSCQLSLAGETAGFSLPDSIREVSIKFKTINNLIVLPVRINDTITVNLILDTGCRNVVLFGKRFDKILKTNQQREIIFSGLGAGDAVTGHLSLHNKISLESVIGRELPIVVVPEKNLFSQYHNIHGIIGYDIFLKFQIEINSREKMITFRPAFYSTIPSGFAVVPLDVIDSRPVIHSNIFFSNTNKRSCTIMIDTGSSIGLLLKTSDLAAFKDQGQKVLIGRGLNGLLYGYNLKAEKVLMGAMQLDFIPAGIIHSDWHNHASIGMEIMKDYIVVLNYCKAYACFKKLV
jgi:hypothetical protein